ncbi:MAG: hypothetical protein HC925_04270 [Coleofasciculaceae cyanobacterium SM2_3_26]|nr:hypothetical protein [Coleofasciculaceae cyanobacterium SM2_3_26]
MTNLDSESNKLEWVKQVRQFLLDLARACLADIPRLPLDLSQRAMPLMKEAQSIQDGDRTHWQAHELDWLEQVRQFLVELTRASLAERPKLPEKYLPKRAISPSGQSTIFTSNGGSATHSF